MLDLSVSLCCRADATLAKPEVNLMTLLSSFDDIMTLEPEVVEQEVGGGGAEKAKLPRTNSLEDLGIKVRADRKLAC